MSINKSELLTSRAYAGSSKIETLASEIGYPLAEDSKEEQDPMTTVLVLGFDAKGRLCWKGLVAE